MKMLFSEKKALGQLKKAFEKIQFTLFGCQFGRVGKKILQIIVIGEQIPMDKLNWLLYEKIAKDYGVLVKHKNLLPFIILTAEDVEGITALAKEDKILAERYLIKYSKQFKKSQYKGKDNRDVDSFKGFLFKKNITLPVNKELSNSFGDVANNASRKAFNKKSNYRNAYSRTRLKF